jgi:hypothetical protein
MKFGAHVVQCQLFVLQPHSVAENSIRVRQATSTKQCQANSEENF